MTPDLIGLFAIVGILAAAFLWMLYFQYIDGYVRQSTVNGTRMKDFLELLLTLAVAVWYYLPLTVGAMLITAGTGSWRVGLGAVCLAIFIVQRMK
jgi:hypothetical protein